MYTSVRCFIYKQNMYIYIGDFLCYVREGYKMHGELIRTNAEVQKCNECWFFGRS